MADNPGPTDAPAAAAPLEAPVVPGRPLLRKLAVRAVFPGLFVVGMLLSWQFQKQDQGDHDLAETPADPPVHQQKKIATAGDPLESLTRGDDALQRHLYGKALTHYEELLAGHPSAAPIIDYRLGLCLESIGQTDRAIVAYRKAISGGPAPALTFAAHLGMARCLLQQNKPDLARRLLYPFLFDENRQRNAPEVFADDARYLVALAMARENLGRKANTTMDAPAQPPADEHASERLGDDSPVSFVQVALEIPFYLDDIGLSSTKEGDLITEKSSPYLVAQAATEKTPALVLKINQPEQPAAALFELLAKHGGMKLELSAEAKNKLADRELHFFSRNCLLLDLLDQAADSFDLACEIKENVVQLSTQAELDTQRLAALASARAGRALQGVVWRDAGHPWMAAICLELGNWEAARGQAGEATKWYEHVLREAQASPYVGPAYYNLALLHVGKADVPRARKTLFKVIDQSSGHELALRAQLRLGQLYLEEDNEAQALVQLKRAQAMSPASAYQPLATLALAATYLKKGRPDQARITLDGQRSQLQKAPYKSTAAFLDTYAQFQLAKAGKSSRREASDLLSTLWRDQDETLLGAPGRYLIAQAYAELGFCDQAERVLRQTIAHYHGPLGPGLQHFLGETLLKQNHREEASRLFEQLLAKPSAYRAGAVLHLAQLDLQDRRFRDCIQRCQELWADQSCPDSQTLLQLWGNALEGTGDFTKAAQCFAGKAPL